MHCPYCGNLVPAGARVCPSCQKELPPEVYQAATGQNPSSQTAEQQSPQVQPLAQPTPSVAAPTAPTAPTASTTPVPPRFPGSPAPKPAAHPGQPSSGLSAQLQKQNAWKSIFVALACGLGAVIVLAFIGAAIATSVMPSLTNKSGFTIGFSTWFVLFFLHASASTLSVSGFDIGVSVPVGLASVALFAGVAFGAYYTARRSGIRFKWVGAVSSAITGGISAFIFLLMGLIPLGPEINTFNLNELSELAHVSIPTFHGASLRTFCGALLITGLGALAGYALADAVPNSKNIFSALNMWRRHARGWVRLLAEEFVILGSVLVVSSILLLIIGIMCSYSSNRGPLSVYSLLFLPTVIVYFSSLLIGGGVTGLGSAASLYGMGLPVTSPFHSWSGSSAQTVSIWAAGNSFSTMSWGILLLFIVFIVAALYVGCRAAARNIYDPARARWKDTWQAPLFVLVLGFVVTLLFCSLSMHGSIFGFKGSATLRPALWTPLLAAVWTFLIEVVGLTFGQNIVRSQPKMWKIFVPGCVAVDSASQKTGIHAQTAASTSQAAMPTTTADTTAVVATAAGAAAPRNVSSASAVDAAATQQITTPLTSSATMQFPPAVAQPREHHPMSKKAKITLITVGSVVAACAVLGAVYAVLNNTVFNPTHSVEAYIQAISDGDFDKASRLVDPGVSDVQGKLLTDTAGKDIPSNLSGSVARIRDARVQGMSDESNGSKRATISYTLDGSKETTSVQIAHDGQTALIFPKWKVSTPLIKKITVSSQSGSSTYIVNGISLTEKNAAGKSNGGLAFYVYPGKYSVAVPTSKYLTSSPTSVTDGESTEVSVKFSSALQNELAKEMRRELDACVAQAAAVPKNCAFDLNADVDTDNSNASYRNWKWSVKSYPTIQQLGFGNSDDSDGSESSSSSTGSFKYENGEADLSYDDKWSLGEDDSDADWTSETGSQDLSGTGTLPSRGIRLRSR